MLLFNTCKKRDTCEHKNIRQYRIRPFLFYCVDCNKPLLKKNNKFIVTTFEEYHKRCRRKYNFFSFY